LKRGPGDSWRSGTVSIEAEPHQRMINAPAIAGCGSAESAPSGSRRALPLPVLRQVDGEVAAAVPGGHGDQMAAQGGAASLGVEGSG
jgi:hypothetical protein